MGKRSMAGIVGRVAIVASLFSVSCKEYSVECELVVRPRVMTSSGSDPHTPAYLTRVYAWYIDKNDALDNNWAPESYADADAGLVRHRTTGEVRSHGLVAEQGDDNTVRLVLTSSPVMLVAVDPVNMMYAYRKFEFGIPLARVYVPVTFKTYLWQQPVKENEWTVISRRSEEAL